jgi:hypothetical protein
MKRKTRDRDRERKRFAAVVRELAEFQTLTSECHILRKCRQHAPRSSSSSSTIGIGYLRSELKLLDDSKQRRSTHQACFDSKKESSWNESFKIPTAFVPSLSVSSSPSSPSSSQAWTNFHTGLHGETSVPHESPELGLQVLAISSAVDFTTWLSLSFANQETRRAKKQHQSVISLFCFPISSRLDHFFLQKQLDRELMGLTHHVVKNQKEASKPRKTKPSTLLTHVKHTIQ